MSDQFQVPKAKGSINVHVIDPTTDQPIRSFSMDFDESVDTGIVINGFHGSQAYSVSLLDGPITISFYGMSNFAEAQTP